MNEPNFAGTEKYCGAAVVGTKVYFAPYSQANVGMLSVNDNLASITSASFYASGPPFQMAFTTQPSGAKGGEAFTTQPVVAIQDAGGNVVTTDSTTQVTLSKKSGPGALQGTVAVVASNGVVTYSGVALTTIGDYVLHASGP